MPVEGREETLRPITRGLHAAAGVAESERRRRLDAPTRIERSQVELRDAGHARRERRARERVVRCHRRERRARDEAGCLRRHKTRARLRDVAERHEAVAGIAHAVDWSWRWARARQWGRTRPSPS